MPGAKLDHEAFSIATNLGGLAPDPLKRATHSILSLNAKCIWPHRVREEKAYIFDLMRSSNRIERP